MSKLRVLRGASHNAPRLVLIDPCRLRGYSPLSQLVKELSMSLTFSTGALLALTAFATSMPAQEPPKAGAPKLLTPEASLNLRAISDLQFSPDGNRLAFVVTEPAKGERRARHIWIYETGSIRQFTYSSKSDFLP